MESKKDRLMNELFSDFANALTASLASRSYAWKNWQLKESFNYKDKIISNWHLELLIEDLHSIHLDAKNFVFHFDDQTLSVSKLMAQIFANPKDLGKEPSPSDKIVAINFPPPLIQWKSLNSIQVEMIRNSLGLEVSKINKL